MRLENEEKEKYAESFVVSDKSPLEIARQVNYDEMLLSYIAWRKALVLRFDEAISLVELGAYAGLVAQQAAFTAPHLTFKVYEAQFKYFRSRYEANPVHWETTRQTYRNHLENCRNEDGTAMFTPKEIIACMVERGFGEDVKNNYWPK